MSAYGPGDAPPSDSLPVLFQSGTPGIVELSEEYGIPVTYSMQQHSLEGILSEHSSDFFVLACYPKILPDTTTRIPTAGCINIHPSLLPRYKGLNPIFWQLRNGETDTGVTLHQVTSEIDGGNILMARKLTYPDGCSINEIEDALVGTAIEALTSLLCQVPSEWAAREQNPAQATWHPAPCDNDFVIDATWRSKTVWNFARAYAGTGRPMRFINRSQTHRIADVLEYGKNTKFSDKSSDNSTVLAHLADGYAVFTVENPEPKKLK
ncbi:MAG: formyltransferase family protein [Acidiferrobacterales bacterium]|nr:formyltransferase family protein [Acidiferrobacterales bacterium]